MSSKGVVLDTDAPFDSSLFRVKTAKASVNDLETEIIRLNERGVHRLMRYLDPETGDRIDGVTFDDGVVVPMAARYAASRCLEDLKHALDQALGSAAVLAGRANSKGVYFPSGPTVKDVEAQIINRCRGVHADLLAYCRALQPHKHGKGELLWAIGRVAGPSKHQQILKIGFDFDFAQIAVGVTEHIVGPITIDPKWNAEKGVYELVRIGAASNFNGQIGCGLKLVIDPAYADIPGNAITALRQGARVVEGVVLGLKAEAERIARAVA